MTRKPKRKQRNWIVEEAGSGTPSESALIVIHPLADIDGISECCRTLFADDLTRVHILVDNRTPLSQVPTYLQMIETEMPNLQYTVRFAHPFVIALVGHLYRRMQAYCEKVKR